MFIEFDCGCIGFDTPAMTHWNPHRSEEEGNILIYRCDVSSYDEEEYLLSLRDMSKGSKPLDADRTKEILKELDSLLYEGYQFRKMKLLLK